MTSVLVGRKKLAAEIRPDKTLPHQKERCEFSHITLGGGGGGVATSVSHGHR